MESTRLSNARDYDITAGRCCPGCGNDDRRLIEALRVGFRCDVCSKVWQGLPTPYRQ